MEEVARKNREKFDKDISWVQAVNGSVASGILAYFMWQATSGVIESFDKNTEYSRQSNELTV